MMIRSSPSVQDIDRDWPHGVQSSRDANAAANGTFDISTAESHQSPFGQTPPKLNVRFCRATADTGTAAHRPWTKPLSR